ncbi:MAG: hypothetical protein JWP89_27 [Schlesneria sp.]|nr:hypothetical protein [Schlesneria sp.]
MVAIESHHEQSVMERSTGLSNAIVNLEHRVVSLFRSDTPPAQTQFFGRCLWGVGIIALVSVTLCGCRNGACKWNDDYDIPPGALPSPLGTAVRATHTEQVARARSDQYVLHNHEWFRRGDKLGPDGRRHLKSLVELTSQQGCQIVIVPEDEQTDEDQFTELNERRRLYVVEQLTKAGLPDADTRVVLGSSVAEGLDGIQATRAYARQFQNGGGGAAGGTGLGGGGGGGIGGGGGGMGGGGGIY